MLTEKVVDNLKKLHDGWGGDNTRRPNYKTVRKVKKVLALIESGKMPFPSVNAMPNGHITLNWISPLREILINIDGDGDAQFMTSVKRPGAGEGEVDRLDSEGAVTDMMVIDHMMAWYCYDKAHAA